MRGDVLMDGSSVAPTFARQATKLSPGREKMTRYPLKMDYLRVGKRIEKRLGVSEGLE